MLTDVALSLPEITFVEIHHDQANLASAGIPRRLGYSYLGETPDRVEAPGEVGIECAWRTTSDVWAVVAPVGEAQARP